MRGRNRFLMFVTTADESTGGGGAAGAGSAKETAEGSSTQKPADDAALGEGGKKAIAAEREARKAAERDLAAAHQALQEMTRKHEEAAQNLTTATQERDALRLANERVAAAVANGLPLELADRLRGSTPEEIQQDAADFKALIPNASTAGRQVLPPDPSQGRGSGGKGSGSVTAGRDLYQQTHSKE